MILDWGAIALGGLTGAVTIGTAVLANRSKSAEVAGQTAVALAQTVQRAEEIKVKAEDDFQQRIMKELERTQVRLESLTEKYNHLATEHARLVGQVETLTATRDGLVQENAMLKAENKDLRTQLKVLDEENEQQGQRLAELNGRIKQLTGSAP